MPTTTLADPRQQTNVQRRRFLQVAGGLAAGALATSLTRANVLPKNVAPRSIAGDSTEPDWNQRVAITVGQASADVVGGADRVIQAAVDYVAGRGGGTVHVLPGTYRMRNSVFLRSKVRLRGSGAETVLFKEPSVATALTVDGDHWDQEVTAADPRGFQVGDGVRLVTRDPFHKGFNVQQRTIVAAAGNRFKLDARLQERFHLAGEPRIGTSFALLQCTNVTDVIIEHLTVDGNRANNEENGVDRGKFDDGAIRLDDSNRIVVRGTTVRNFYCDGIVWGISHDVLVEDCQLLDGVRFGVHPGSGSQRSIVRGNRMQRCKQGIYFCWGAQHGLHERNLIEDCGDGMTLGHRDTDNLIRENEIRRSGRSGIRFRGGSKAFAAHRNRFERNLIVDSGPEDGVAIDINGETEGIVLLRNRLRETRQPLARIGIKIGTDIRNIDCDENAIEGFATTIADLRKA